MHIPPEEQNARVVLGHGLDREDGEDTAKRAASPPTNGISARAAEPNEPDRRSIAIEPDSRLRDPPHFPCRPVPQEQPLESAVQSWPRSEQLAFDRPTAGR